MRNLFSLFVLLIIGISQVKPQGHYQSIMLYKTSYLGNGKDSLRFPLVFHIQKDSIIIKYEKAELGDFVVFKIEGNKCLYKQDSTVDRIVYNLLLTEKNLVKHPTLSILFIDNIEKYIDLIYEDGELRRFSIAN